MYSILLNISLFLMLVLFRESTCCSCLSAHNQDIYCNSEFVIRARALNNETVTVPTQFGSIKEVVYTVKILEAFRFDGSCEDYSAVEIYTAESSAACGVYLETGSEYLLTGTKINGKRSIFLCGWNTRWESLDSCVRDYLIYGIYEANCHCQIAYCNKQDECNPPRNSCVMDRWQWSRVGTSVCQSKKIGYNRNICSWKHCPTAPIIPTVPILPIKPKPIIPKEPIKPTT